MNDEFCPHGNAHHGGHSPGVMRVQVVEAVASGTLPVTWHSVILLRSLSLSALHRKCQNCCNAFIFGHFDPQSFAFFQEIVEQARKSFVCTQKVMSRRSVVRMNTFLRPQSVQNKNASGVDFKAVPKRLLCMLRLHTVWKSLKCERNLYLNLLSGNEASLQHQQMNHNHHCIVLVLSGCLPECVHQNLSLRQQHYTSTISDKNTSDL